MCILHKTRANSGLEGPCASLQKNDNIEIVASIDQEARQSEDI